MCCSSLSLVASSALAVFPKSFGRFFFRPSCYPKQHFSSTVDFFPFPHIPQLGIIPLSKSSHFLPRFARAAFPLLRPPVWSFHSLEFDNPVSDAGLFLYRLFTDRDLRFGCGLVTPRPQLDITSTSRHLSVDFLSRRESRFTKSHS